MREPSQLLRPGERDDGDAAAQLVDLAVELPQLREVLLAVESTEVAEEDKDGGPAEQLARRKPMAVGREEVDVGG